MNGAIRWCSILLGLVATLFALPPAAARGPMTAKLEIVPNIGHDNWVTSVALSPDGRLALSASDDGALKLWDAASARLLRIFDLRSRVTAATFSADGRSLLSGSFDQDLRLWDVGSGKLVRKFMESGSRRGAPTMDRSSLPPSRQTADMCSRQAPS